MFKKVQSKFARAAEPDAFLGRHDRPVYQHRMSDHRLKQSVIRCRGIKKAKLGSR